MLQDALGCSRAVQDAAVWLGMLLRCSGMLWDALRCSRMLQDARGCFGVLRDALGCQGKLQNVSRCLGMLGDALTCLGMLQDALRCSGMLQDAEICSGMLQEAVGFPRMLWDAQGISRTFQGAWRCFGMFWGAWGCFGMLQDRVAGAGTAQQLPRTPPSAEGAVSSLARVAKPGVRSGCNHRGSSASRQGKPPGSGIPVVLPSAARSGMRLPQCSWRDSPTPVVPTSPACAPLPPPKR